MSTMALHRRTALKINKTFENRLASYFRINIDMPSLDNKVI